ncbi:MAG TPA: hypothetical protein VLI72_08825, partial [Methylibium sp.]|nr:hypothetical protein [Methylibium sp.]
SHLNLIRVHGGRPDRESPPPRGKPLRASPYAPCRDKRLTPLLGTSTSEEISFDVAGIKVHSYERESVSAARTRIAQIIRDALAQVDLTKGLQVQKAIDALDADALEFIRSWGQAAGFHGPAPVNMAGALLSITKAAALSRLQALGVVRCDPTHPSGSPAFYWTEFGKIVVRHLASA